MITSNEERVSYAAGHVIGGKYRLDRKIGEGAMGAVWIATNTALGVRVAIKLLLPSMTMPLIVQRFLREARAAAMLAHPGIVRVFDYGETDQGEPFIVMELLAGEDFRDTLLREIRLSPEDAVAMLLPVASAMHAAHERGIIHRDLKPENIFFAYDDAGCLKPKVVDFGIARFTWEPRAGATGAAVIGTLGYMAPEQALASEQLDRRADIFAFSAVVYEAIAGRTPFAADDFARCLDALMHEEAPSLAKKGLTDGALWEILERGLRKEPANRWASMRDLGRALAEWLLSRGVTEDVSGGSLRTVWGVEGPSYGFEVARGKMTTPILLTRRLDDPASELPSPSSLAGTAASSAAAPPRPRKRSRFGITFAAAGITVALGSLLVVHTPLGARIPGVGERNLGDLLQTLAPLATPAPAGAPEETAAAAQAAPAPEAHAAATAPSSAPSAEEARPAVTSPPPPPPSTASAKPRRFEPRPATSAVPSTRPSALVAAPRREAEASPYDDAPVRREEPVKRPEAPPPATSAAASIL